MTDGTKFKEMEELGVATRVPITNGGAEAGAVRRSLEGRRFESATHIAVCEENRLVGVLRIETLLQADPDTKIGDLMDTDPPCISPDTDQEQAAWLAGQRRESALAVVDDGRRFLGFIRPERLLAVLLREHEEDMARLGGFLSGASAARTASQESLKRRFWHRLPWLLLGLAGALFGADIVALFEKQLQGNLILAFFIAGVVYLADAVGTQTETIVVRGLSVGVGMSEVFRREAMTGLLVGLALSLVFLPIGLWRWGQPQVLLAIALSIFATCSIASLIAMTLPWMFDRLGKDPAFGSGPLATVLQDLSSVLIYFGIAALLLG
jgi:magnesium transporter